MILLLTIVGGVYCSSNNVFDVYVMVGFGVIGYLMRKFGDEPVRRSCSPSCWGRCWRITCASR